MMFPRIYIGEREPSNTLSATKAYSFTALPAYCLTEKKYGRRDDKHVDTPILSFGCIDPDLGLK